MAVHPEQHTAAAAGPVMAGDFLRDPKVSVSLTCAKCVCLHYPSCLSAHFIFGFL